MPVWAHQLRDEATSRGMSVGLLLEQEWMADMIGVDFDPDGLTIARCRFCARAWWAEIVVVDHRVLLREWHRARCADWGDDIVVIVPDCLPLTSAHSVTLGPGLAGLIADDADGWTGPE